MLFSVMAALPTDGAEPGGTLRELQPAFKELLPPDAMIEKLKGGFQFTEGPVWHRDGHLLFTDIPANRIVRWNPEGSTDTFRRPSGNANGLTFDQKGRLIACEHSGRRVSRTEADGTVTSLAERYDGKRLNSPNDAVVRSDGSIYFTDPPYGLGGQRSELGFQGVFRIAADGSLLLLARDIGYPNGLAFSPDEKLLYVCDSQQGRLFVFDVQEDGTLANRRLFARMGTPDGMKVDVRGNLYVTASDGVRVLSPEGVHLGTLRTREQPANCTWGDADGHTLYVTAQTGLYRVRLAVEGIRPK
jgi:sugar lactone lactonase YvrE